MSNAIPDLREVDRVYKNIYTDKLSKHLDADFKEKIISNMGDKPAQKKLVRAKLEKIYKEENGQIN